MQFQRVSPTQILVQGPLERVREVAWHALRNRGSASPLIDVEKNLVFGSVGAKALIPVVIMTAQFEAHPEGTLISFKSKPPSDAFIKFGLYHRHAEKTASTLERVLAEQQSPTHPAPHSPLAAPNSLTSNEAPLIMFDQPAYGSLLAPKLGTGLLLMAVGNSLASLLGIFSALWIFSALFSPQAVLFATFWCIGGLFLASAILFCGFCALKDYKRHGDPGDKPLVIGAMALASIVALSILGLVGAFMFAF